MAELAEQMALELYPDPGSWISGPVDHARALHPPGRPGVVAIRRQRGAGGPRWREEVHSVAELPEVLAELAGTDDVYLSTQRFWSWRRIALLAECGALYVDLDYYSRPELRGSHPRGVLREALDELARARLPAPSLAIGSGRGLYLMWLHAPIPRAALPRWNACQKVLYRALKPLGADAWALDAARVLRVIGTRHGGAGVMVEQLSPVGDAWEFEDLAREVLPWSRAEVRSFLAEKAVRRSQEPLWTPHQRHTQGTLWAARLDDLQEWRRGRYGDGPMRDHRHRWLFLAGLAMSWMSPPELPLVWERELLTLARQAGGWTEGRVRSELGTVLRRARMAARGRTVRFAGEDVDARYRYTNQRIIDLLEIAPEEERGLKTIISGEERRRRDRTRDEERRREAGAMTRDQYEGRARTRAHEALRRAQDGDDDATIAGALGVSVRTVRHYLKAATLKAR